MKRLKTMTAALAACLAMAGGGYAAEEGDTDEKTSMEQLQQQWNETMEALGSYTADQRDQALESGRKTLDAMDERIERMEDWTSRHWDSLSEEAREKKTGTLEAMREQRRKVAEWYGGMKHSSAETWDTVKEGFIKSYDKLQNVYRDAVGSFSEEEDSGAESGSGSGSSD